MRLTAIVAGLTLLIDQISKIYVVHGLQLDRVLAIDVFPPWLNLRMAWNRGMNFGMFAGEDQITRWFLIVVALAISGWVWFWIRKSGHDRRMQVAAGLLIGGALGNVIDRIWYGAVADFINMSLPSWSNPYSFNVADITIFVGAIGLVLLAPDGEKPRRKTSA
ncbi:signal peptidase II [Albirhodobacter sp. R86504]|jgi:signal peptidase II|uniref:signal peptidase II n=1 Tax=Albirhodobacter sp. R86504 TaxID=3093848 RepID=UPI00366E4EF0